MHECMKEVENGGLKRLTNKLRLGVVQNLEGMKDFGEEERFGLREIRERLRNLRKNRTGSNLKYI